MKWKTYLMGLAFLLCGMVGMAVWSAARHLWQDHLALHELAVIEMRRQQLQK